MKNLICEQLSGVDALPKDEEPVIAISEAEKMLFISDRNVTRLLPAFGRLTSLTILRLDRNGLVSLPRFFGKLTNLEDLSLTSNEIRYLPASFSKLTKLTNLYLHSNFLNEIPHALTKLTSLKHLDIDNNPLQKDIVFPPNWSSLKLLSIEGCNQNSISPTINNLVNIITLSIGENYWHTLPSMEGLTQILDLSIHDMELPILDLPESIKYLTTLENLGCQGAGLSKLPDWLPNLSCLLELELTDNHLKELPENIGNMQSLKTLELSNNQLRKIPKSLARITTLLSLNLTGNKIDSFPIALYEQNPDLYLIVDDDDDDEDFDFDAYLNDDNKDEEEDLSDLETSESTVKEDIQLKAKQPQSLEVQVARRLVKQKEKLTPADLPPSCLELINSAKECSTHGCDGIFIRGGGVEESFFVQFSKHLDDFFMRPVLVDKHTCDFRCQKGSPQNRT